MRLPILLASALLLGIPAIANAQPAPPAPPERGSMPDGPGMPGHPGMQDHPGMPGHHGMGMMGMMRPPKAAIFHFGRGESEVHIKCADDESTRACVDAAAILLDKLASSPAR